VLVALVQSVISAFDEDFAPLNETSSEESGNQADNDLLQESSVLQTSFCEGAPDLETEIFKAGVIDTIQKPYDFRDMLKKIHAIIGQAQVENDHPRLFKKRSYT
jgi:FixJ family two-component response regulator